MFNNNQKFSKFTDEENPQGVKAEGEEAPAPLEKVKTRNQYFNKLLDEMGFTRYSCYPSFDNKRHTKADILPFSLDELD